MNPLPVCSAVLAGTLWMAAPAAQDVGPAADAMGARERALAHFERLPEAALRSVVLHCEREAGRRLLGLDEAAPCSMAWEALLRRAFGGDLEALLAWWRQQRT